MSEKNNYEVPQYGSLLMGLDIMMTLLAVYTKITLVRSEFTLHSNSMSRYTWARMEIETLLWTILVDVPIFILSMLLFLLFVLSVKAIVVVFMPINLLMGRKISQRLARKHYKEMLDAVEKIPDWSSD